MFTEWVHYVSKPMKYHALMHNFVPGVGWLWAQWVSGGGVVGDGVVGSDIGVDLVVGGGAVGGLVVFVGGTFSRHAAIR